MNAETVLRSSQRLLGSAARLAAIGILPVGAWAPASQAQTPPNRIFGVSQIGGLAVGASYLETMRYWISRGARASAELDVGGCALRYPGLGLRLWYFGNPLAKGSPDTCDHFAEAVATSADWHTRNGLFVGDSASKLRRLFPHAYDTRHAGPKTAPRGSIEWDITITCCGGGERPALSAMVRGGRVVALRVAMVGH